MRAGLLALGLSACVTAPSEGLLEDPVHCADAGAGHVRTTTDAGLTLWWPPASVECLPISRTAEGTDDLPGEAEWAALERAMRTWNVAAEACPAPVCLSEGGITTLAEGLHVDPAGGRNLVYFVVDQGAWPREYARDVFAVTDLKFAKENGQLFDADISINNWSMRYAEPPSGAAADLESVLLHELGHVLAFAHPGPRLDSAMRAELATGQTRRSLGEIDRVGLCAVYCCY